jgi:hypothetical protein
MREDTSAIDNRLAGTTVGELLLDEKPSAGFQP